MRYKVGDKVVICKGMSFNNWDAEAKSQVGKTRTIKSVEGNGYFLEEIKYTWWESDIDHEATAKLTLPQPSKDMLRSGMKVVYRNKNERFVLKETGSLHDKTGYCQMLLNKFNDSLKCCDEPNADDDFDIMQIWDGDTLIAQRTEKSESELKKESLEKQVAELSASINVSVKQLDKLKEEIKSL